MRLGLRQTEASEHATSVIRYFSTRWMFQELMRDFRRCKIVRVGWEDSETACCLSSCRAAARVWLGRPQSAQLRRAHRQCRNDVCKKPSRAAAHWSHGSRNDHRPEILRNCEQSIVHDVGVSGKKTTVCANERIYQLLLCGAACSRTGRTNNHYIWSP